MRIITKIGGIILNEQQEILVVRKLVPGRETFIIPGGKPEPGESELETLRRELEEEVGVQVISATHHGNYVEPAEFEDAELRMSVYDVITTGEARPQSEIVELKWINRSYADEGISVGSTLALDVIPSLVASGRM